MTEHYTAATESVFKFCAKCGKLTKHAVSSGRIGRCMEHEAAGESKKQTAARLKRERAAMQTDLVFDREPGCEG